MAWVSMLPGNIRHALGGFVDGWEGPENVQGFERKDGDIRKVRSDWSHSDGRRKQVEVSYTARGTIIRQRGIGRSDVR